MTTLAMHRPAVIQSGARQLDEEMRAARWLYHRLLDFEDQHQTILNGAAEMAAPGISRTAALVARLLGRAKRRDRTTAGQWSPNPHPEWLPRLRSSLAELRTRRNKSEIWKAACSWADGVDDDAPDRGGIRRKSGESDEDFAKRSSGRRNKLTRREAYRKALYDAHVAEGATERSRVYWGTWNFLLKSVDRARKSVLEARKSGMPAEWRRPKRDDRNSIAADAGGFRIVDRGGGTVTAKSGATVGNPWWTVEMRLASGWVRFRAKFANWHELPADAKLKTCTLTRDDRDFSVSITVAGMPDEHTYSVGPAPNAAGKRELLDGQGLVALDWGHREHGHPNERDGLRVFVWVGEDGRSGEILLPKECRDLLDEVDAMKSLIDEAFNARKTSMRLPDRNRYGYRNRLLRSGVLSQEEAHWLTWESRYERRISSARDRIVNLRKETYLQAIRGLRRDYGKFAIEDETIRGHRKSAKEDQTLHRKRQNRELSARYEFVQLCERLGATMIAVPARNSTRECPWCGELHENTADLLMVCPSTGRATDKDYQAGITILRRGEEALAKLAAAE
jgi:hypothetical protein